MKIELIDSSRLQITLTRSDLQALKITFDEMESDNPYARLIFTRLLWKAKAKTGFSFENSNLFLEIYPDVQEGCTLCFTALDKEPEIFQETSALRPSAFAFQNLDTLTAAVCRLLRQSGHPAEKSSVFRMKEEYILILYPSKGEEKAFSLLHEYGRKAGEGELYASFIGEHGRALIEEDALDKISLYLS